MLGLVLLEIFEAQLQLRDLGIQTLGGLAVLLASQRRQLRPEMLDFDRRRAKLGARRGQFVPQCGDLFLGRAVCQVHMAILPEGGPYVQPDHPRERSIPVTPQPRAALSRRACASQFLPAASTPAPPSS